MDRFEHVHDDRAAISAGSASRRPPKERAGFCEAVFVDAVEFAVERGVWWLRQLEQLRVGELKMFRSRRACRARS